MILLIGSEGSMGKRYQAIFNHLQVNYTPCDIIHNNIPDLKAFSKILIATPTMTHFDLLRFVIDDNKDILCEKPICKSSYQVSEVVKLVRSKNNCKFNMVFQYGELAANNGNPHQFSSYDYFRTGNDGLYWDCLQIFALASGPVKVSNKSPYWQCTINDTEIDFAKMDYAYVKFIRKWLNGHLKQDHQWLIDIHKKVEDYVTNL